MKPGWCVLALVASGCLASAKLDSGEASGGAPHDMAVGDHTPKTPPVGTRGGPTGSGWNGATQEGGREVSDKGQVAVVCDVAASKLDRFDCTAMQKVCVLDSTRGARCATLPPPVT